MKAITKSSLSAFICLFTLSHISTAAELDGGIERLRLEDPLPQIHLHEIPADHGSYIGLHLEPKDVINFHMTCKGAYWQVGEKKDLHLLGIEMMHGASTIHPLKIFWKGEHIRDYDYNYSCKYEHKFKTVEYLTGCTLGSIVAVGYLIRLISFLPVDSPIAHPIEGMHNALYYSLSDYDRAKCILGCSLYGAVFILNLPRFMIDCKTFCDQEIIKEGFSFWQKLMERRSKITYDYLWIKSLSLRNTLAFDSPIIKKLISLNNNGVLAMDLFLKNIHIEEFKETMSFSINNKSIKSIEIKMPFDLDYSKMISINTPETIFDCSDSYSRLNSTRSYIKLTRKVQTSPTTIQQETLND